MAKQKSDRSIWNQTSTDVGNAGDKETMKVFEQMTGSGLVNTETGTKNGGNNRGNNRRV